MTKQIIIDYIKWNRKTDQFGSLIPLDPSPFLITYWILKEYYILWN